MKTKRIDTHIYLDPPQFKALQKEAKEQRRTFQETLRVIIDLYFSSKSAQQECPNAKKS